MHRKCLLSFVLVSSILLYGCGSKSAQEAQTEENIVSETETETEADSVEEAIPYLPAANSFTGGSGTKEDPYQIATAEQLAFLAEVNDDWSDEYNHAYYVLTSDIQLNDLVNYEKWDQEAPEYQWKPVGYHFSGSFDGAGYTISGLYVQSMKDQDAIGLFGNIAKATVSNVKLEKSCLKVKHTGVYAGSVAGQINNVVVNNCSADIDIYTMNEKGMKNIGGIVGWSQSDSTIENCTFNGEINCEAASVVLGGISGYSSETLVSNCEATGSITVGKRNDDDLLFPTVGGIIGSSSNMKIGNSTNRMNISGEIEELGGICGKQSIGNIMHFNDGKSTNTNGSAEITNCVNYGELQSDLKEAGVGGIVGVLFSSDQRVDSFITDNCENFGDISGDMTTAGIIGDLAGGYVKYELKNCKNNGAITANNWCGGIVGRMGPTVDGSVVRGCVNTGSITATAPSGGIIGSFWGFDTILGASKRGTLLVENCKNSGEMICNSGVLGTGGILGLLSLDKENDGIKIIKCINTGRISMIDSGRIGGILGAVDISKDESDNWVIEDCMNQGLIQCRNGELLFTEEAKEKVFEDADKPEEKTIMIMAGSCMGGISGQMKGGLIKNCLSFGDILIDADYQGFVGTVCGEVAWSGNEEGRKCYISDCKYSDSYPFAAMVPLSMYDDDPFINNTIGINKKAEEELLQEYEF